MTINESADNYEQFHYSLVTIHGTLQASMDQIIEWAPKVPESDVQNFIGYVEAFNAHFQTHHHHEEDIVFPAVSPKIPIDKFVDEHRQLDKLLKSLSEYTTKVKKKDVPYESTKIVELINQISDLIRPHLKNEEDTFSVQALRENFTVNEINQISDQLDKDVKKGSVTTGLPFALLHLSPEDRVFMVYSKMPWFVKKVLVPHIFVKWKKGYWKYAKYPSL